MSYRDKTSAYSIKTYKQGDSSLIKIDEQSSVRFDEKNASAFLDGDDLENEQDLMETQKERKMTERDKIAANRRKNAQHLQWNKMNDKQREDEYFNLKKTTLDLKKKITDQDQELKQLKTRVSVITNEYDYLKKGVKGDIINKDNQYQIEQLKLENKRLKEKLNAIGPIRPVSSKKAPTTKKSNKQIVEQQEKDQLQEELRGKKFSDMVRLIEILKTELRNTEEQNKNLQALMSTKVQINTKDSTQKNIELVSMKQRYEDMYSHFDSVKKKLEDTKLQVSHLTLELKNERDKSAETLTQLTSMKMRLDETEKYESQIANLIQENRKRENDYKQLASQPFFQDFKELASTSAKLKTLQKENQDLLTDNKIVKEKCAKLEKEKERRKLDLDQKTQECNDKSQKIAELNALLQESATNSQPFKDLGELDTDNFMKALNIVKWKGEDPTWTHLKAIDRKKEKEDKKDDVTYLRNEIGHLILEKGELASHLEKTQSFLQTRIQYQNEKEAIQRGQIERLQTQLEQQKKETQQLKKMYELKGFGKPANKEQIYQKGGVNYTGDNDNMSVFSTDDSVYNNDVGYTTNYVDVYVGVVNYEERNLRLLDLEDVENYAGIKTFATLDFYDHHLCHTKIVQGLSTDFKFQAGFKVNMDELFYKYLHSSAITVEVFSAENEDTTTIGTAQIPLNQLIEKNTEPYKSFVIKGMSLVYSYRDGQGSKIETGQIDYILRFRYPPFDRLHQIKEVIEKKTMEIGEAFEDEEDDDLVPVGKKKLIIIIEKATGLQSQSHTFVYFSFQGQDYYTSTEPGKEPKWIDKPIYLNVNYDDQMKNYFRNNKMEFILFDDNVAFDRDDGQSDIIGTCDVPLIDLTKNSMLSVELDVLSIEENDISRRTPKGKLYIRLSWSDGTSLMAQPKKQNTLSQKAYYQQILKIIAEAMQSRCLQLQNAFYIFDRDQDNIINMDDFVTTCRGTLSIKNPIKEELENFYNQLDQPFDWTNFQITFKPYLTNMIDTTGIPQLDDVFLIDKSKKVENYEDLGDINQKLQQNSENITRGSIDNELAKYQYLKTRIHDILVKELKSKNEVQIFKEIDKDGNQQVSHFELKTYLRGRGLSTGDQELNGFLETLDGDSDNKIDLKEFMDYIMGSQLNSSLHQSHKSKQSSLSTTYQIEITEQVLDGLIAYMRKNNKNFIRIHEEIDTDKNNYLSKAELKEFLQTKLELNMKLEDINTVVSYFDKNNDDKISVKEFMETMKSKTRAKSSLPSQDLRRFFSEPPKPQTVDSLVNALAQYMKTNDYAMSRLFNVIDSNKDGYLSRKEMKQLFIEKISLKMTDEEFEEFFVYFDTDRSDKVSVAEFVEVIAPELQKVNKKRMSTVLHSQSDIDRIRKKAIDISRKFEDQLYPQFVSYGESDGTPFINREEFKKILMTTIPLTHELSLIEEDCNALIDHICTTDLRGQINYKHFLGLDNVKYRDLDENESMIVSKKIASDLFKNLYGVIRRNNISIEQAFKSFDKDSDGKINGRELYQCLRDMGLEYNEKEVDLLILAVDKNKNGTITLNEFKAALKENA